MKATYCGCTTPNIRANRSRPPIADMTVIPPGAEPVDVNLEVVTGSSLTSSTTAGGGVCEGVLSLPASPEEAGCEGAL